MFFMNILGHCPFGRARGDGGGRGVVMAGGGGGGDGPRCPQRPLWAKGLRLDRYIQRVQLTQPDSPSPPFPDLQRVTANQQIILPNHLVPSVVGSSNLYLRICIVRKIAAKNSAGQPWTCVIHPWDSGLFLLSIPFQ